ncbi:hypothetical protein [Pelagibius sp.]|uniref:hypothetical protein n=1 Tax=Pelagibius sp. TaxID=1931238 RepID=UPI00260D21AB|nr:hypothetical protein [Pelagibius sp.]
MTGFKQIIADDWAPGPFRSVAAIRATMAELVSIYGFEPDRIEEDGLGWVQYVLLELRDGTRFILEWGEQGPTTDVTVSVDARDPAYGATLQKLLSVLKLDQSVVVGQLQDGHYDGLLERQSQLGVPK